MTVLGFRPLLAVASLQWLGVLVSGVAYGAEPANPRDSTDQARKPALVPPRLSHFEPAEYPGEAAEAGLEATVLMEITIDSRGKVSRVEVRQGAGHGFDEAAASAAERFIFEPALRSEVPVAAKILYRYQFKLEPKAVAAVDQQAAERELGELQGKIVAGSPPAPLAGVSLRILAPGTDPIAAITDLDGSWVVPKLAPGDYVVEVNASGYRRLRQLEQVDPGRVTALEYTLEFSDELPLEISVRGVALEREVTHYELPRAELLRVPGTMGDPVHAVEAMPSVGRPRGLSGALIVRGSAPEDTQVYLEGTLIPRVFHYLTLVSVVPGEMVERLEFYPSNFSARYGRGMGGVVEIKLRETNPDGKLHGSAQVDFINARLNVEGHIPQLQSWSFMAGLRASYLDRWLVPLMRDGGGAKDAVPRYQDAQLYLQRRLPNGGFYRIGLVAANDTYVPLDPKSWRPQNESFWYLQSQLRWPLSRSLELKATSSLGRNQKTEASEDDNRSYHAVQTAGALRAELSLRTGRVGIARIGTDLFYGPFTVQARTDPRSLGGELAGESLEDAPRLTGYHLHGVTLRPAAYAEYELAPTRRVDVTLGTRLDYSKDTNRFDVAPRLAARYVVVDRPLATVIKGGIGLFYQPPDPRQTLAELGTSGLESSRAVHSMLGFEQALSGHLTVSVEGFQKELRRLLAERTDGSGRTITENTGEGRVWGVDVLLRYQSDQRFFGWIAYTLSRSTRRSDPEHAMELYRYDQTHALNLLASYRLGHGWEAGGRLRYMTGFPYHVCSGGLFDNSRGSYRCYETTKQARLGAFHQLDFRIEKSWEFPQWRLSAYLDLINAYNHQSPDKSIPNYDYSNAAPLSLSTPVLPSLGIRGEL